MAIDSAGYYDEHAEEFFEGTAHLNVSALYDQFLPYLPPPPYGHILDAGCGSGRDSRAFRELGFRVSAFDASAQMVARARAWSGVDVQQRRFEDVEEVGVYYGIWACASLLHVPRADLPDVLGRLARALKPWGVLYCSFKAGQGEREKGGRLFTDMEEYGIQELLDQVAAQGLVKLKVFKVWRTGDLRPGREGEEWVNAVLLRPENHSQ